MRELGGLKADFREILYHKREGVATVTIDRPQALNSFSTNSLKELAVAFTDAAWDDSIAVVVLTGAGERAFSAGGDVKEYVEEFVARPRDYWKWIGLMRAFLESVLRCGKPVIGRVNGLALGGGHEALLACDLAIMAEHASLGQVGTSVGSVPAVGATQWLPLVVGDRLAREMVFRNTRLTARQAKEAGLVNAVAPTVKKEGRFLDASTPDQVRLAHEKKEGYEIDFSRLDAEVRAWTSDLRNRFPECLRYAKTQLNHHKEQVWNATIAHAQDWLALHFATPEPAAGMRAFVEKRPVPFEEIRRKWSEDRSPEYPFGPPAKQCACGAAGLPAGHVFCGVCGARI